MRGRFWGATTAAALTAAALTTATPAGADTLQEALAAAYRTNPTLTGARAGLAATDENVAIARAQGLPNIGATGTISEFVQRSTNNPSAPKRSRDAAINATIPLFQGGFVRNSIRAAEARVLAGRADLQGVESNTFTAVVAAYMDVIRDTQIVDLNAGNTRVLERNLQATNDRFQVGDLTRTDVAQSEARLALARSDLEAARAQLDVSRENYMRLVGSYPRDLQPPPAIPPLPANTDEAVNVAVVQNPTLEAARQQYRASDYDVDTARSYRLPKISAFGSGTYVDYRGTLASGALGAGGSGLSQTDKTATVGIQATLPLYQGGGPSAQVRQAKARKSQAIERVTEVERQVVNDARVAFSRYQASLEVIKAQETATSANALALEGTRAEQGVGSRNILDVLNAEQELLNARTTLVSAERDAYVAGFALLAVMGRAQAADLGIDGGPLYDPTINYRRMRGSFFDWNNGHDPQPVATRTVGIAPPTAQEGAAAKPN
ncbi:TolC family outer membrane protein [Sphingomonas sp. ID0503]|uniref:TolC family outer membrane protein n=1 Tax=Sphingomonas sp. ID0503 TaxID=3399691 RepID=UPI003AFB048C